MAFRPSAHFPPASSTSISSPPTPTNGCSARAARAFFTCANRCRQNCGRRFTAGTISVARILSRRNNWFIRPDARRYEAGSANLLGLVGLNAAMELLLEIGRGKYCRAVAAPARLDARARPATKRLDRLQADAPPQHASGIISFYRPETDLPALREKLLAAHIETSLRTDRAGPALHPRLPAFLQHRRRNPSPVGKIVNHFARSKSTGTLMLCWTRLAVVPRNKSARKRWPWVLMATRSHRLFA